MLVVDLAYRASRVDGPTPNIPADPPPSPPRAPQSKDWFRRLGPGVISGAADDDPSGVATYSQAGAQFGLNMLWAVVLAFPLIAAVQSISARIGRVTGEGLAAAMTRVLPKPLVALLVGLLLVANTVNIGADLAAMGAAVEMVVGLDPRAATVGLALFSLGLQVFVPYHRYVRYLKWLTLSLFAYVGVVFAIRIDWMEVAARTILPQIEPSGALATTVVAVFGTTISPYLFFWQAAEEVEEERADPDDAPLSRAPEQAPAELARIGLDTYVGMAFSSLIAFFIILTTASTLFATGQTDIRTASEAAEALRPIAGEFAFFLFALGIVGTGLLAVPVLAGSAAYAVAEAMGWPFGLERKWNEAKRFYAVLTLATLAGLGVLAAPVDPFQALYWSAVLNGLISVPVLAAMMIVATRRSEMGRFTATRGQRFMGWAATAVMAAAAAAMLILR